MTAVSGEFRRDIDAIGEIFALLETFTDGQKIDDKTAFCINLVVEELFTNMVRHNEGGGDRITVSIERQDELATITLAEAVTKLKEPKKGRSRRGAASVIADLGTHPESGENIQVKTGRYGPYVTDGTVNATVPKGTDPEKVDLDQAVELLAKREEKLRSQGKDPRAKKKTRRSQKK